MIVTAPRAAAILYQLLCSRPDRRPFLLPANICPVVPLTFLKADMPFEFVDLDPITLNLDLVHAESRLRTGAYGGILYAHTYGDASTPVEFFTEARHLVQNLLIIDDRCLNFPDLEPDPENSADVHLYSTGYAKMVDFGSGGYAFLHPGIPYHPQQLPFHSSHLDRIEKEYKISLANRTRFQYSDSDWLQTGPAPAWEEYKQRLSAPESKSHAHRMEINAVYRAHLPPEICLPDRYQLWRFNIRVKNKADLLKAIFDAGLFASSHYASLAGIFAPGSCLQAEALAGSILNLFNDHHYTVEMAERTCDIILQEIQRRL